MKDTEMRGVIIQKYYEHRKDNEIVLKETDFENTISQQEIVRISKQLSEHGLIEWRAIEMGSILGKGRITANGIDVIEKGAEISPIEIVLDNRQYNIIDSKNVQVGNNNSQDIPFNADKIIAAINGATATSQEKKEAKSLFQKILDNPLLKMVLGQIFKT